ncbi:hypothetical protein Droror1_Dr00002336 [Drosera rotundifolia]
MESTDSSSALPYPQLPPGFRFHPTDEELIVHYLKRKAASTPLPVAIIADIDLYKFDPWELPAKAIFGEQEWYFFSPRDRKYPNGARPNRAATSGYWKATGTDKPVLTATGNQKVGVKKALVFYRGKPPRGIKSDWIMHEYRLLDGNSSNSRLPRLDLDSSKKASSRLDDWVLCRIYKKSNIVRSSEQEREEEFMTDQDHKMRRFASNGNGNYFEAVTLTDDHHHHHQGLMHHHTSISQLGPTMQEQMYSVSHLIPSTLKGHNTGIPAPYWDEMGSVGSSSSKGFHSNGVGDGSTGKDGNNSYVSLLNQLPPVTASTLLGQVGHDHGVLGSSFHLGSSAWNS